MNATGWVYDAYPTGDQIVVWMKTDDERVLKLTDSYLSEFYATPRMQQSADELAEVISTHPLAETASICMRILRISDREKSEAVRVTTRPTGLRKLVSDIEATGLCTLYNIDLNPVQRYFVSKGLAAIGKFTVNTYGDCEVKEIRLEDTDDRPPICAEEIDLDREGTVSRERLDDSKFQIIAVQKVQLPRFYALLRGHGLSADYGLRPLPGKLVVDHETFRTLGIAGLDEKSRFAGLPIGVVSKWGPARLIDSRQCYEAIKRGVLIPWTRTGTVRNVLTAKEVAYTDRGALILSPRIGLHENVAELDFKSLFPSIIVKHNISYETVSAQGVDLSRRGFLPQLAEQFIKRRQQIKQARNELAEGGQAREEHDQRERILKKLLVSLYGYIGSDLNRFGNVFAYREINRIGRETVVAAMNAALRVGFEVIYLDTDSVFVKKHDAKPDDFQGLARRIEDDTGFEISIAHHYLYLVLLPQDGDPQIEAARRFYGKLADGRLHYRGIELRRHDYPIFMKRFQERLLDILLDAEMAQDIPSKRLKIAVAHTKETLERVLSGDVPIVELRISKVLRMPVERYRSMFPHVIAATRLHQQHKPTKPGDLVEYVYVDSQHTNPTKRVAPAEFAESYDLDKYAEMTLDVAESILSVFGFSRIQLGFQPTTKNFLENLRGEKEREILCELESLGDSSRAS
jgi:hypothetical protein